METPAQIVRDWIEWNEEAGNLPGDENFRSFGEYVNYRIARPRPLNQSQIAELNRWEQSGRNGPLPEYAYTNSATEYSDARSEEAARIAREKAAADEAVRLVIASGQGDFYDITGTGYGAVNAPPPTLPTPQISNTMERRTGDIGNDSSHVYVGTDQRGDVWQMVDEAGNVLEWAVPVNADSREIIAGSLVNLGPPSAGTIAQTRGTPSAPVAPTAPAAPTVVGVPGAVRTNPAPAPSPTPTPPALATPPLAVTGGSSLSPVQGDPRHKYVGRDGRGDVWQIFDGVTVKEWAVRTGDDSRNIIPGTLQDLGQPGPGTVAQNDGTTPSVANAPMTNFGSPGGGGLVTPTVLIGLASLAISALK